MAYAPASTTVLQGSVASGSFSSLTGNDGAYYVVNSTTSGATRFTDWYASVTIAQAPGSVVTLTTTYDGKYSRSGRTQTLYLYNWSTGSWTQIDSRSVGQSDVTITNTQSSPANFISPAGEIRLRVLGSGGTNKSFTGSGDQVQFVVETAGSTISRAASGRAPLLAKLIPLAFPEDRVPRVHQR